VIRPLLGLNLLLEAEQLAVAHMDFESLVEICLLPLEPDADSKAIDEQRFKLHSYMRQFNKLGQPFAQCVFAYMANKGLASRYARHCTSWLPVAG
jgi:hypothetical protein